MAGDWIPIDVNLPGKPEVALLSADLRTSTDEVVGLLVRFWIWCQSHTVDGFLAGLCPELIARVAHVSTKFLESLEKVGWLEVSDQGVRIPNFDRWFGGAAKRRLMEARKKRLQRESKAKQPSNNRLSRSCPDSVPILSRCDRDKNGTRGEESRGENLLNPSASAEGSSEPNGVRSEPPPTGPPEEPTEPTASKRPSPDEDAFAVWWAHYPRKVGKQAARRAYIQARRRITQETGCTPAEARRRLLEAVQLFARTPKATGPYCPHAATWLNQGRYEDDPAEWRRLDGRNAPTRIRRAGRYDQPQLLSAGSAPEASASGPPLPPPFTLRTAVGADSEGGAGGDH